jgi:FkbM family methyltransferase
VISYAQNYEDVVLSRLYADTRPGRYVDIGAGDPVRDSVTKHFYDLGWRGINVEPQPELFAALSFSRPDDVNLRLALGESSGRTTLNIVRGAEWGWSTTDPALAASYLEADVPIETVDVEVSTLAAILDSCPGEVDFLKIDVEGAETSVLTGADLRRHRPRVILVEAVHPTTRKPSWDSWEPILLEAGYEPTLFDGLNRFYAQSDDQEAQELLAAPANVFDEFEPYRWVQQLKAANDGWAEAQAYAHSLESVTGQLRELAAEAIRHAKCLERSLLSDGVC